MACDELRGGPGGICVCAEYEMWHDGRLTSFADGTPSPG